MISHTMQPWKASTNSACKGHSKKFEEYVKPQSGVG